MKTFKNIALLSTVAVLGLGIHSAQAQVGLSVGADTSAETNVGTANGETTEADAEIDFSEVDENEDGQVTETEFSNSIKADTALSSFQELDKDGNGALSETEFDVIASMNSKAGMTGK